MNIYYDVQDLQEIYALHPGPGLLKQTLLVWKLGSDGC